MSVPTAFGSNAGPVPFAQQPASDEDFGPKFEWTVAELVGNKVVRKPNPKYVGKTLVIDVKGPATFTDKETGKEKTAVDTESIRVVETGEVFERQRIFVTGVVRQIQGLAGQSIIATVGHYEMEKRPGQQFVQLEAPSEAQVAAAQNVPAAPATDTAPF